MSREHETEFRRRCGAWVATAACLVVVASGCKSGASFSKPSSWWAFGGSKDPSQLAAAPPFEDGGNTSGNVAKPSSMASPYPTTTTPQGYVVNGATASPVSAVTTAQASAGQLPNYPSTDDAAPITYGQPAPTPLNYPDTADVAGAVAAGGVSGGIATQTGPYATLPAAAPAMQPATPDTVVAPARIADSRMGSSFGDSVAPATPVTTPAAPSAGGLTSQPAAAAAPVPESRYQDAGPSRFGGSRFGAGAAGGALPTAPSTEPSAFSTIPAAASPASVSPAPLSPPPGSADPLPVGPANSSIPAAPPRRRPNPGYRPGGTSSYRPSSSILVGEPSTDPAVRAASFSTPAEPVVR